MSCNLLNMYFTWGMDILPWLNAPCLAICFFFLFLLFFVSSSASPWMLWTDFSHPSFMFIPKVYCFSKVCKPFTASLKNCIWCLIRTKFLCSSRLMSTSLKPYIYYLIPVFSLSYTWSLGVYPSWKPQLHGENHSCKMCKRLIYLHIQEKETQC